MSFKTVFQASLLIGVGCMQLTGDLLGLDTVKALGAISHASPAPKVFTAHEGYETYSPEFFVSSINQEGQRTTLQLTPELSSRLQGPYNRRNAYGAALSYGPVLASDERTAPMFESVVRYALCEPGRLPIEIGLPVGEHYEIEVVARTLLRDSRPTKFAVDCRRMEITPS